MQIIKIGGNELGEKLFLQGLATAVSVISEPVVIVHGGGKAIADMQQRLGLVPQKVDGVRVTDAAVPLARAHWQIVAHGHTVEEGNCDEEGSFSARVLDPSSLEVVLKPDAGAVRFLLPR